MSTKIYNGTRIPVMDAVALMKFLKALQPKFDKAVQDEVNAKTVRMGVGEYDERTLGLVEITDTTYTVVNSRLTEMYMGDPTKRLQPWCSTKCEVAIFPLKDKILTIFYGERDMEKIWNEAKGVKFYGYWNNVDADEKCSAKEWKQRQKDWDKVLTGDDLDGIPATNGLGFQFTSDNVFMYTFSINPPTDQELMKYIPDMEFRLRRVAERMVDREAKVDTNAIMSYLSSEDRKKKVAEQIEKVRGKLEEIKSVKEMFSKKWEHTNAAKA